MLHPNEILVMTRTVFSHTRYHAVSTRKIFDYDPEQGGSSDRARSGVYVGGISVRSVEDRSVARSLRY